MEEKKLPKFKLGLSAGVPNPSGASILDFKQGTKLSSEKAGGSVYLYLLRHAPAFPKDHDRWPKDSQRPLTPEGEKEFRLAARGLARMVPRADVILSSPARRAWQTAEILSELDCWPAPIPLPVVTASRRRASPQKATLALEDYAEAKYVAVVGHKPRLQEFAAYLLTGEDDPLDIEIKKGGVMCIRFDGARSRGAGKLRWLLTPKALLFVAGKHFS
jgi:phosphohistidine phosphatase